MNKINVTNQLKFTIILFALFIGTFLGGIEAKAATSGTIPCSEGSITWELDANGVLTFSGNGTTDIKGNSPGNKAYGNWDNYWEDVELNKEAVVAIKVEQNNQVSFDTCKYLFRNFRNCKSIDLSGFETENAISMRCMFDSCNNLTDLDTSKLVTTNTTDMSWMFFKCNSLSQLDVSGFDTKNVKDMSHMFYGCKLLTKLDVSEFDTGKVTNMKSMFYACKSLSKLDVSGFDTRNVTDMSWMFHTCKSLTQINLSNFNTTKVTTLRNLFMACESLIKVDLSSFDTRNVTDTSGVLYACKALEVFITPKTQFVVKLPTIPTDKYWVDINKNFYTTQQEYTFNKLSRIHRVNGTYNINYITDGQTVNCPTIYKVTEGLSELGTVIYPSSTFVGWYLDAFYSMPITTIEKGTFGDITLYGKFISNTFKITYKNIDGISNQNALPNGYNYGTELEIPKAIKDGFSFAGWFLDEACTNSFSAITKTTEGDLILYAKWEVNVDSTEQAILNNGDNDIKGSSFSMIQARATKTTKNSITLKWNKVKGADGYMVYGNKCNPKNKYEPIKTIKNGSTTTFTHKKRKKGTYYKYIIYAYKVVNGKREKVAVSKTIHATTKDGKYTNSQSVKVNKTKVTLKKNKTFQLKCSEVAPKGKKVDIHRAICYESSNTQIVTVTKKGVIKAKKKGACYVYAYAQNCVYKKIKVMVK